ncbi:MAG: ABC transporter permease subunit [Anaerolineaceae bacterium]|nr:ABC transporter permease subunit [Anaerolineaceae bacterium]
MKQSKNTEFTAFFLGIILIGCLIQAAGWIKGDNLVFPNLPDILRAFFRLIGTQQVWLMIWTTLRHLILSLAISTLIGLLLGVAEGYSNFIRSLLRPLMVFLRSIPMVVLVVIIMVLTKYERVPLIATSLLLIPLISEAVCEGVLNIDRELIDVYRLNSGFNLRVLLSVYLPLMTGFLKQAYVSAVGMGLKMVVSTEYLVQTKNSLGKAINTSIYFNEYEEIYAFALIMILLVVIISKIPVLFTAAANRNRNSD